MILQCLALLLMIGCMPAQSSNVKRPLQVRCFDVPKAPILGTLRIRKPHKDSNDLLLAWSLRVVPFYDYEKKTVEVVARERWENATGVVTNYTDALFVGPTVQAAEINLKLLITEEKGKREILNWVPTEGKLVLRAFEGFSKKLVAVLTLNKMPERLFENSKDPETTYLELFRLPGGEPVGEAFKLPFSRFDEIEVVTWSRGDTHLVVSSNKGNKLCIVDLPTTEEGDGK